VSTAHHLVPRGGGVVRLQYHTLFAGGGKSSLSCYHYGIVDGVARQSHATVVARGWAHIIVVWRVILSRHQHFYSGGA
jgi:hypothetical protein